MNHQLIKEFIQKNRLAEAKDPIPSDSEQLITEAMRPGAINKAVQIATRYLQKKTGNKNLFASAGLEHFKNSNVRFLITGIEHSFDGQGGWETKIDTAMKVGE